MPLTTAEDSAAHAHITTILRPAQMEKQTTRLDSTDFLTLIYCFLLSTLFRFPYFFEDVLNWDESTFILTGQSLLDGNLPYTELWDLKPPLLPAAFALFITLFGKSIVSIRIAGAVCVALTAWLTYLTGKTIRSRTVGWVAATLTISSLGALNYRHFATMSEHVALLPLMGAMLILLRKPITPRRLFWVGLLLSSATMIRLNLAYVALGVGLIAILFLDYEAPSSQTFFQKTVRRGVYYSAGALSIIFLTWLPYLLTNQSSIWWDSVILAPLSYSESTFSMLQAAEVHGRAIFDLVFNWDVSFLYNHVAGSLLFLGAVVGICVSFAFIAAKQFHRQERRWLILLFAFLFTAALSILNSGQSHLHYLLQIMPFLALLAAFAYAPLFVSNRWKVTLPIAILAMFLMLPHAKYQYVAERVQEGKIATHGTAYRVALYFEESGATHETIYMMNNHIAYWLIDQTPLTSTSTHPSNISKEYLLQFSGDPGSTTQSALQEILEQEPEFIVTENDIGYLDGYDEARAQLDSVLAQEYQMVEEFWGTQIYKRIES